MGTGQSMELAHSLIKNILAINKQRFLNTGVYAIYMFAFCFVYHHIVHTSVRRQLSPLIQNLMSGKSSYHKTTTNPCSCEPLNTSATYKTQISCDTDYEQK